jgi:protein phosphatase-4 regulatory subunit 3
LVDYPDDDDEDIMDTKPEGAEEQPVASPAGTSTEIPASPPTQTPTPPERLAEKRRREEEDDDELSKLTTGPGPKRRSSTSSNSNAFIMNRKKNLSAGSLADKNASPGVLNRATSAAPKRIAINIGSTANPPLSETDNRTEVTSESYEKENRNDSQGNEGG